jgi:hypothetical protein
MLVATAVLVGAGLWYFAHVVQNGITAGLVQWADQRRQQGWTVDARLSPVAALWVSPGLALRGIRLQGTSDWAPGGFQLAADHVDVRADMFDSAHLKVTIKGNITLRLGAMAPVSFTADQLTGLVTLRSKRLGDRASIVGIAIDGKNLHSVDGSGYAIGILDGVLALDDSGAKLDLRTEASVVPADVMGLGRYGLGQHLSDVTLTAALVGWPPALGSRSARADIWRASGGEIDVSHLVVGWGPLGLVGQGRLGLNQNLQPDLSAKLQVRGFQTVLQGLGENGALVASVLAAADPDGVVEANLRLKKGNLTVNRIPVAKFPAIKW